MTKTLALSDESRFEPLDFDHSILFRISIFGFRIFLASTGLWPISKATAFKRQYLPPAPPEKSIDSRATNR